MSCLIEVRDLKVRRDGRMVLDVEHLSVLRGQVLGLIGINGAGKTTLLLTLARLLRPEKGTILLDGHPTEEIPLLAYRRRIALVLQEPLLLDRTVFENVALGVRFRGVGRAEREARVATWLDRLGIAHLSQRKASALSGGEGQRVSLARAFVLEPELLLLDEPFSGLDPPTRADLLFDLRATLQTAGTTAIFVTHDLQDAALLADQVALLQEGRIAQVGHPTSFSASSLRAGPRATAQQPRVRIEA